MSRLSRFLLRLTEILTAELLLISGALFVSFLAFLIITKLVFLDGPEAFDTQVFAWFDALRARYPGLTPWVLRLTFFGSALWFIIAGLGLPGLLWWRKLRREAVEVLATVIGASLLNQLLKMGFGRVRPLTALLHQPGLSFPSGHAMIGLALYGMLAWQLWRHGHHPVWASLLLLWGLLVGLSRIYLHVHYPTDVLAGFAAGISWVVLVRLTVKYRLQQARQNPE
ncbi:phosphatase PAP2 family protein [Hymenobacter koreensis]|uniref:Phosphatase PAP2 family protein n=1 Tax=Hymenobacter koreensis TaxID=1084523 RepID=A0ABP8IV70_9BACT